MWVGVALNAIAGCGAWFVSGRVSSFVGVATSNAAESIPTRPLRKNKRAQAVPPAIAIVPQPALAAAALGVSGFASLSLQVVWTRLLAMMLGPTTYAFSMIVAVFIARLAVGAV